MHFRSLTLATFALLVTVLPSIAHPVSEDLAARTLLPRGAGSCSNDGKIGRDKYDPNCLPSKSKGYVSAHNCFNKGGKSYLCVQGGKATCYPYVKGLKFEGGECFM